MHSNKRISGIMATTSLGVIGKDNNLPWHYPSELAYFREMTRGHTVIMGRKTFEPITAKFFTERYPIIFSRSSIIKTSISHTIVHSLEEFTKLSQTFFQPKAFMIGGAEIAHLFLEANLISEFFLTKIHKEYRGDTYLNLQFFMNWSEEIIETNPDYTIIKLKNPQLE